ncbi:MAG: DUF1385 domain-containing protein [Chloroflexota bacterium]|nr:DUF1385 domain-containing protein [Chloroflexota bacterium]
MSEKSQNTYGGQALIEGVMIRGKKTAVLSVRSPEGEIIRKEVKFSRFYNPKLLKIPLLRGILNLIDSLIVGTKALNYSAVVAEGKDYDEKSNSGFNLGILILISLTIAIGLFFVTPALISQLFEKIGFNKIMISISEGILRLILVISYIFVIGLSKDIKRVFQYHGAEHMAVWAHEDSKELTKDSISNYTKEHPRCGTSFILIVVMVSIVVFMFFPRENIILFIISRIVLVPVIAGISYELLKFGSKSKFKIFKTLLNGPGILIQKITTREPDDDQMDVAIDSMNFAIELNEN